MRYVRHQLPKAQLLDYALDGARTLRGLYSGTLTESEAAVLDEDIAEIERRIKLVAIAEARKESTK